MKGKDLFLGLSYIDKKYIEEAELEALPRHRTLRRPLLVAAIVALALLLVGCTVVYLLSMREIKLGDQEVTYDVYDYDPESGEALAYVGKDTMTQQVLTLAGLSNTPAAQAAREWYDFLEAYDPDLEIKRSIWGNIPDFGDEYYGYDIYTQEMKDKLDGILDKYGLKLKGKRIEFQTHKLMFKALGMENVLNPGSEAVIDVEMASYYENGNFNLHFLYDLPGDEESGIHSQGWLYYRNKDCFIPDTAVLTEAEWEEWNYTTASGDQVLIVRSEDAASAWFFSDLPNYTASLRLSTIQEMYEEKEDGVPVAKFRQLTKAQLERVADSIDFSLEPRLMEGWEDMDDGAVNIGQEINGYRIDVESAFTDGYSYQIVLKITAPEGVNLTDPEDFNTRVDPGDGHPGACEEDGDGKLNTCHYILQEHTRFTQRPEDGSLVYPEGYVVPIYWEDLYLSTYDMEAGQGHEELLTEGLWKFDVPLNDADYREIEFLTEPITAKASTGWRMDGSDVVEDLTVTSIRLCSMGIHVTCQEDQNGDFLCFDGKRAALFLEDGTEIDCGWIELDPVDLDKVVYLKLTDGTVLPVPGREEEAELLLSEEVPEPEQTMPVFTDGVELLTQPITMKHLGGWVTDATGDVDPLYEYLNIHSVTIHPWGLCIYGTSLYDDPEEKAVVTMKDGDTITLSGKNADPLGLERMSQLVTEITMDLDQVKSVLLPDGTELNMP